MSHLKKGAPKGGFGGSVSRHFPGNLPDREIPQEPLEKKGQADQNEQDIRDDGVAEPKNLKQYQCDRVKGESRSHHGQPCSALGKGSPVEGQNGSQPCQGVTKHGQAGSAGRGRKMGVDVLIVFDDPNEV